MIRGRSRPIHTSPRPGLALAGAIVLLLLFLPLPVMAQAGGGGCDIESVSSITFGIYDPLGANLSTPLDSAGSITFFCRASVKALAITIDQGLSPASGSSCASPLRQMASGSGRLRYDVYHDAGFTQPWGCQASSAFLPALPNGNNQMTIPIHGRIPPSQDPPAGGYADTLTITLIF